MAETVKVVVKDARVHPETGYCEVDLVAVKETQNSKIDGPLHTYGIDAAALHAKYGGNVKTWLAAMKGQHLTHSGHHEDLVNQLMLLKGKEI